MATQLAPSDKVYTWPQVLEEIGEDDVTRHKWRLQVVTDIRQVSVGVLMEAGRMVVRVIASVCACVCVFISVCMRECGYLCREYCVHTTICIYVCVCHT